jgi:hypothetical protein
MKDTATTKKRLPFLFLWMVVLVSGLYLLPGCYYDVEEELYPNNAPCDTTNVTFSLSVKPILDADCNSCHGSTSPQGGIILDTYNGVLNHVNSGALLGAIRHDNGFLAMPQGGSKLSNCKIQTIEKWVADGALNN